MVHPNCKVPCPSVLSARPACLACPACPACPALPACAAALLCLLQHVIRTKPVCSLRVLAAIFFLRKKIPSSHLPEASLIEALRVRAQGKPDFRSIKQALSAFARLQKRLLQNASKSLSLDKTSASSARKSFGVTHVMVSALGSFQTLRIQWFQRRSRPAVFALRK